MKRNEIEKKYKWDNSDIYNSRSDILEDIKILPDMIKELANFRGHLLDSSDTLYDYIVLSRKTECIIEKIEVYYYLIHDVELDNKEAIEGLDKAENIINEYNQTVAFFTPEILESDEEATIKMIEEDERLAPLKKHFKDMFKAKKHLLSEESEKILASMQHVALGYSKSNNYITDKEIDYGFINVDGSEVKLLASNIPLYARNKDREVRKSVYLNESNALKQHNDSLATNYISYVKASENEAKFRHFDTFLEQKFYGADLSLGVYDTLKCAVKDNHDAYLKYQSIYRKNLGYDDLHPYDLNAPLFEVSDKKYTVEEAKDIILDTFSIFGEEYLENLKYAFDNGCIDYFPCENKSTGWSSIYSPYTIPKVFANFEGKILDISSLSHELGHFCNQYMTIKKQIPEYTYQTTFCAEVASLTNEILFSNLYMKKEEDVNAKRQLLFNFIKTFAGNFFGAARQALFEEDIHMKANRGEALSSSILNDSWLKAARDVFGDTIKDYSPYSWSTIPHFFLGQGYYVYNYSTAIVAATNVASKILNHEEGFIEKYMEFLKLGSSKYPEDALLVLGIDMKDIETYNVAIKLFSDAIDELEKITESR